MTDPPARKMHMADGGYRPALNAQFSSDTKTQFIVGAGVVNIGSDGGRMLPAVKQLDARYGFTPNEFLVDGGFSKREDIEQLAAQYGTKIFMPIPKSIRNTKPGCKAETPHVIAWRERMATLDAQIIYKERASTIECVNALARNRGLQQFRVRGLSKVTAVVLLFAIAHNIMCLVRLSKKAAKVA